MCEPSTGMGCEYYFNNAALTELSAFFYLIKEAMEDKRNFFLSKHHLLPSTANLYL